MSAASVPAAPHSGAAVSTPPDWQLRDAILTLDRPRIMGILNLTSDSFSDGGHFVTPDAALRQAMRMAEEGADLLDLGGESTRPGAAPVDAAEEIRRVIPVLRLLRQHLSLPLSVDTRKAEVARASLDAGADVVNDVSALADPGMVEIVADAGAGLVLMHMRGTPPTMQNDPRYDDVATDVARELGAALDAACEAGIGAERIVVDPGIGFGKTAAHNLELIDRLPVLAALGHPVLLGVSRKAFLGSLLGGLPPAERDVASAAACVVGWERGARIFRVHNVQVARQALNVAAAIRPAPHPPT